MTDTTTSTTAAADGRLHVATPHRELLDHVLDKWSLSVLNELCERPCRFNELRRAIPAVTQKSLTATLRRLERNGIVDREVVHSRPVAVVYRITALGKTLRGPVEALLEWAEIHMAQIEEAREKYDDEDVNLDDPNEISTSQFVNAGPRPQRRSSGGQPSNNSKSSPLASPTVDTGSP